MKAIASPPRAIVRASKQIYHGRHMPLAAAHGPNASLIVRLGNGDYPDRILRIMGRKLSVKRSASACLDRPALGGQRYSSFGFLRPFQHLGKFSHRYW